jgi:hypothetical protein
MRTLPLLLLSLCSLYVKGQIHYKSENWHGGIGFTAASLNFQQNGAGGIAIPFRYDLLKTGKSSISLGSNIKIGSADKYGASFPVILALVALLSAADNGGDFSGFTSSSNNNGKSNYNINLFTEFPLLLHYNFGLGTFSDAGDPPFGFYIGGGMSYTVTGIPLNSSTQQSTSFFGWVANAGVRFARNKDLGFSMTQPLQNPIGPINNPIMYELTFSFFWNRR